MMQVLLLFVITSSFDSMYAIPYHHHHTAIEVSLFLT
ncbi:hypothetical protein DERF_007144 [Dermatophagoides farinae]|uniref:Uncharacterized protein n=1 Tax=Dermatophagoides farinae TaxID=6954 RepID=A0A922HZX0_DERFA|nr:hypothetical protein DERF_007144 [Dermatophagoides farinae]